MKYLWTKYATNPPAPGVLVVASWTDPPEKEGLEHMHGEVCRRGCCFRGHFGKWQESMVDPIWWRPTQGKEGVE